MKDPYPFAPGTLARPAGRPHPLWRRLRRQARRAAPWAAWAALLLSALALVLGTASAWGAWL